MVLAGPADASVTSSAHETLALSVWDVRYLVVLSHKMLSSGGEGLRDTVTSPMPPGKPALGGHGNRPRSGSSASGGSGGVGSVSLVGAAVGKSPLLTSMSAPGTIGVGSYLSSAQAVSTAALSPFSVFQVLVSEDNAFVATVSRRNIVLTDVAARGASLLSAVGRGAVTRRFLRADDPLAASLPVPALPPSVTNHAAALPSALCAAHLPLATPLDALLPASRALPTMSQASILAHWRSAHGKLTTQLRADCEAVLAPTATPTPQSLIDVISRHDAGVGAALASAATAAGGPTSAPTTAAKRPRTSSSGGDGPAAAAAPGGHVLRAFVRSAPITVPTPLAVAVAVRTCAELAAAASPPAPAAGGVATPATTGKKRRRASAAPPTPTVLPVASHGGLSVVGSFAVTAVTVLMQAGAISSSSCPFLFSTVLSLLQHRAAHPAVAAAAFQLLCTALAVVTDLPEQFLVACWRAAVQPRFLGHLQSLASTLLPRPPAASNAAAAATSDGSSDEVDAAAGAMGLLLFTGLVVRAPRNDVFLEQTLAALPLEEVVTLLHALHHLFQLRVHSPPGAVFDPAGVVVAGMPCTAASALMPTTAQVVDWLRMTLDAHYARLALRARAASRAPADDEEAEDGEGEEDATAAAVRTSDAGLIALLRQVASAVAGHVAMCEVGTRVRTHMLQLLAGNATPAPAEPSHVVEAVDVFAV